MLHFINNFIINQWYLELQFKHFCNLTVHTLVYKKNTSQNNHFNFEQYEQISNLKIYQVQYETQHTSNMEKAILNYSNVAITKCDKACKIKLCSIMAQ